HHRGRHRRQFLHQPVPVCPHGLRCGARHHPGVADLGIAERRRGVEPARPGEDAPGIRRLGQGARKRRVLWQPWRRHDAASLGRAVHDPNRHQGHACAVPRRGGDHSGDARRRRDDRDRQPRIVYGGHRVRADARARGHLARALADAAGRADHGRGRGAGFRRHLLGRLCAASRDAAADRRQALGCAARHRRGARGEIALRGRGRALDRLDPRGGPGLRGKRADAVAGDGQDLRRKAGL
ncbi:MAG: BUG/TctC family periplasmic protein, partial [uncultured Microvirga sp.]